MTWETINQLLGRAAVDDHFAGKLVANPLRAAQEIGCELTAEEKAILQNVWVSDITELSQTLLSRMKNEEQPG